MSIYVPIQVGKDPSPFYPKGDRCMTRVVKVAGQVTNVESSDELAIDRCGGGVVARVLIAGKAKGKRVMAFKSPCWHGSAF